MLVRERGGDSDVCETGHVRPTSSTGKLESTVETQPLPQRGKLNDIAHHQAPALSARGGGSGSDRW